MSGRGTGGWRARWSGPPILVHILMLIVGALIVAQLVTLILTLVLPPAPPRRYELADIAATLKGETRADARPLERIVQAGPPDLGRGGWLVSARARDDLARMLGVPSDRVVLGFYTALPVGAGQPARGARLPLDAAPAPGGVVAGIAAVVPVSLLQGPPGGGGGGGPPRGGRLPGGRPRGGSPGDGFPGGGFPGGGFPGGERGGQRGQYPDQADRGDPAEPDDDIARDTPRIPDARRVPIPLGPERRDPPVTIEADPIAVRTTPPPPVALPPIGARVRPIAKAAARAAARAPVASAPASRPIPFDRAATGLFGFAPAPFVEGDFVAAVRGDDGRWTVVAPRAEGFPNSWQRRVLLWFALSLLIVAPLAWGFAQRIVRPLKGFARAAERLGRDPAAAILPLDGPAEVGRAAHAFNLMQSRLRSFVDDRTAMVGAISHDLRTPLTRMRFRVEDVPDAQREGLLHEILAMEAMISSVIAYIRDASTPNARERLDLATLIDDVVEDAVMIGGDVATVSAEPAPVDVDALGMRRVLDNLLANAVKYGTRARVMLHTADSLAIADIVDDGPGIPDDEIERVFEPFYRSEAARASTHAGSGLGLAVCRSIARAHGGDVALFRSADGFVARVSLPLAYEAERRLVA